MKIQNYLQDNLLSLSDKLIGVDDNDSSKTKVYTLESIANFFGVTPTPYKIYTALLTQRGSNNPTNIWTGNLTVGVTYQISDDGGGANHDFTNVGAESNNFGTYFVATGTTPASWGINVYLSYNTAAPIVTVLENTLGNINWFYDGTGFYYTTCNGLFIEDKTYFLISDNIDVSSGNIKIRRSGNNEMDVVTKDSSSTQVDSLLTNTPIEIRVYN